MDLELNHNPAMRHLAQVAVALLLIAFIGSVTCALACAQVDSDKPECCPHQSTDHCPDCVDTHFVPGMKYLHHAGIVVAPVHAMREAAFRVEALPTAFSPLLSDHPPL